MEGGGSYFLEINRASFDRLNDEQQKAILRHEAIHVGHEKHDFQFRMIAKSINAPFKGNDLFGNTYKVFGIAADGREDVLYESLDYDEARLNMRGIMKLPSSKQYVRFLLSNR
jgi:hypothetical protein